MSLISDTLSTLRRVVLLDHRISELETTVRDLQREVSGQDRRLLQIETIIYGPVPPDQLRIPRR